MPKVLVHFATTHGHTAKIAGAIGDAVRAEGVDAEVIESGEGEPPDPAGFDGVVAAASLHAAKHQPEIVEWARENHDALESRAALFLSVSLTAAEDTPEARETTQRCIDQFVDETGWPGEAASVAGALQYREYDFFTRTLMRLMMRRGGHPTDASHDYDYTDWTRWRASATSLPLASTTSRKGAVELYWLPLGAGGHSVKYNGRVYEWVVARLEGRPRRDLFHAALQVQLPAGPAVVEQAPVPDLHGSERGVVAEGPVGARWLGRFRLFRYEIRVWRGGSIPDIAEAVDSPRLLSNRFDDARRLLDTIRGVPTLTWGRDEIGAGEMWNSNAVIAWSIAKSGLGAETVQPPEGGRAPGWQAGIVAAGDETKPIAEARC